MVKDASICLSSKTNACQIDQRIPQAIDILIEAFRGGEHSESGSTGLY